MVTKCCFVALSDEVLEIHLSTWTIDSVNSVNGVNSSSVWTRWLEVHERRAAELLQNESNFMYKGGSCFDCHHPVSCAFAGFHFHTPEPKGCLQIVQRWRQVRSSYLGRSRRKRTLTFHRQMFGKHDCQATVMFYSTLISIAIVKVWCCGFCWAMTIFFATLVWKKQTGEDMPSGILIGFRLR